MFLPVKWDEEEKPSEKEPQNDSKSFWRFQCFVYSSHLIAGKGWEWDFSRRSAAYLNREYKLALEDEETINGMG